ncbi:hypothetical protein QUC26_09285 [Pseudomonas asiatica]|uniref:hypothetical protein n=1 Tax=Pseudomonas asiatica TaxID=2219225 RepID=UPI0025A0D2E4|nr:hypothetical protein [Pseudomonas asiatica]WJM55321.1 hypothetical protein QUC26_09285 [Pseudomonas asiatica]
MSENPQKWYRRPVNRLQAIVLAVLLTLAIIVTPIIIGHRVDEYEYNNIQSQKEIVDKRVNSVEDRVQALGARVSESEIKINTQLQMLDHATKRLEEVSERAAPEKVYKVIQQDFRERQDAIQQNANPVINVSPTIITNGR